MSRLLDPPGLTLQDLADRFGPMPLRRIRMDPLPGTATELDVIRIGEREDRTCELIDGILVEKDVSTVASLIAARIIKLWRTSSTIEAMASFSESKPCCGS